MLTNTQFNNGDVFFIEKVVFLALKTKILDIIWLESFNITGSFSSEHHETLCLMFIICSSHPVQIQTAAWPRVRE